MAWNIDIATLSRNDRRLQECIEDRALKTSGLELDNAKLRATIARLESEVRDLTTAVETLRTAHAIASTNLLQTESIIERMVRDAARHSAWHLGRWVRFGPKAQAIDSVIARKP
ncbi:hypothetical protein [Cupriavidus sp. Marseille-Q8015]